MENHSQEEEKPYKFKKQENGMFKVYSRETDEPLEGFELEEFNSPLVGHRYINGLLKAMDSKLEEKVSTITTKVTEIPEAPRTSGFEIPIIGEEPVIHVFGTKYYELVVHEQDSDAKRKDIYLTDGVSRDFHIMYDVPVMLPEGCLNVLRESVYTQHECVDDVQHGKVLLIEKQVPRFSIQVIREVPQEEAEKWLKDKNKIILQKV